MATEKTPMRLPLSASPEVREKITALGEYLDSFRGGRTMKQTGMGANSVRFVYSTRYLMRRYDADFRMSEAQLKYVNDLYDTMKARQSKSQEKSL